MSKNPNVAELGIQGLVDSIKDGSWSTVVYVSMK